MFFRFFFSTFVVPPVFLFFRSWLEPNSPRSSLPAMMDATRVSLSCALRRPTAMSASGLTLRSATVDRSAKRSIRRISSAAVSFAFRAPLLSIASSSLPLVCKALMRRKSSGSKTLVCSTRSSSLSDTTAFSSASAASAARRVFAAALARRLSSLRDKIPFLRILGAASPLASASATARVAISRFCARVSAGWMYLRLRPVFGSRTRPYSSSSSGSTSSPSEPDTETSSSSSSSSSSSTTSTSGSAARLAFSSSSSSSPSPPAA
mmetsp:Transcript_3830/g.10404  ORF Transcript_3830/g.10404 Transcript_3830/m.10404 type:complete len:264 (+) Transcript_3830:221-1012(+)